MVGNHFESRSLLKRKTLPPATDSYIVLDFDLEQPTSSFFYIPEGIQRIDFSICTSYSPKLLCCCCHSKSACTKFPDLIPTDICRFVHTLQTTVSASRICTGTIVLYSTPPVFPIHIFCIHSPSLSRTTTSAAPTLSSVP
jgi:hypothetical protein